MTVDHNKYTDKYDKYDKSVVGTAVISLTTPTIVGLGYPGLGKGLQFPEANIRVGYLSGYWTKKNNVNYACVEFERLMGDESTGYYQFGYVEMQNYKLYQYGEKSDTKSMLDEMMSNNMKIYENNLLCAGLISKLSEQNIALPADYAKQLYALQLRLEVRNDRLNQCSLLTIDKQTSPAGFELYRSELESFMGTKIGATVPQKIAPILIVIIVSVIFTALVGLSLYNMFKPDYTDSKADLKVSDNLTKAIATLSPEARQEVLNDLEGQIDKAYVEGKMSGSGMGIIKTIGYALAAFAGFIVITKLNETVNN
ncbi:MAG: hypothetical protein QM751_12915 [Paludibacteraceae bacterium]